MPAIPPTALLALFFAAPAVAQGFVLDGPSTASDFGAALARLDDLDGDGVGEIAIGIPGDDRAGINQGAVEVVSGADGSLRYALVGAQAGNQFGSRVIACGDLDGDGVGDLAVASRHDGNPLFVSGRVDLYSGDDGSPIRGYQSASTWDRFGLAIADLGDLDGDGVHDLAIGAPDDGFAGVASGSVEVRSGSDGSLIHVLRGAETWDRFGWAIAALGDTDGDGVSDFLVSSPFADIGALQNGEVRTFSGRTGKSLRRTKGRGIDAYYGKALVGLGDIDGDNIGDYAASAINDATGLLGLEAYVDVRSGLTGKLLYRLEQRSDGDRFGFALAAQDLNDDGFQDLVIGAPMAGKIGGAGLASGEVSVHSGPSGRELLRLFGSSAGANFGSSLADSDLLDANAYPGLTIGAPGNQLVGRVSTHQALRYPRLSVGALVAGQSASLHLELATPFATYQFSASTVGLGSSLENGGALLDLAGPVLALGSVQADAAGNATLVKAVPANTTGLTVAMQAWLPSPSSTAVSSVVVRSIQ